MSFSHALTPHESHGDRTNPPLAGEATVDPGLDPRIHSIVPRIGLMRREDKDKPYLVKDDEGD